MTPLRIMPLVTAVLLAGCGGDGPTESRAHAAGSVRVIVTTLGGDPDLDGYEVVVESQRFTMPPNGATVVGPMRGGSYTVGLDGVAPNCTVVDGASRQFTIAGGVIEARFVVSCVATGVEVAVRTTGAGIPAAYAVHVGGVVRGSAPANGSAIVSRLAPGTHQISLVVRTNCAVTSDVPVAVTVTNRSLTAVAFDVTCSTPLRTDKIAYVVADGVRTRVILANPDGTDVDTIAFGNAPAWSADGTKLVFSTAACDFYYGQPCTGGIVVVDPESRDTTTVVKGSAFDPAWSPDGRSIAFTSWNSWGTLGSIHILDLASGEKSVIVLGPGVSARQPSWSPDGRRIAFACSEVEQSGRTRNFEICVIGRDATGFARLTSDAIVDDAPTWSPNGLWIAFTTQGRFPASSGGQVALVRPDSGPLTFVAAGESPSWTADGRIFLARSGPGHEGLYTVNPDGTGLQKIVEGRAYDPVWRP